MYGWLGCGKGGVGDKGGKRTLLDFLPAGTPPGTSVEFVQVAFFSSSSPAVALLPSCQWILYSLPPSHNSPESALGHLSAMGDSTRPKTGPRTASHGSNVSPNNTSAQSAQSFSTRADLEVQIAASPSPISSAKDTRSWLETKGWLLPSEENSKLKLADILLSATLSFKLLAKANSVIRLVAFLLQDHADKEIAATVTNAIIDKVIDKINAPLGAFNESVSAAKEFLDATLQKHASELLELQDSTKQQAELVKLFAEASAKLAQSHNPQGLADATWPQLTGSNHQTPLGCPAIPQHWGNTQADPKVIQRVSFAAKQLLIEYSPLDDSEPPHPKTAEAQRELRQRFNSWIDNYHMSELAEGQPPPAPSCAVCNVLIFDRPAMLLEFDSVESKNLFVEMIDKNALLLNEINPKARIQAHTFAVIFRFIPCTGPLDPSLDEHLRNIEMENDLPTNSIATASWCKRPDRRSPSQTTATLKVACISPNIANLLLTGRIRIDDHLVIVRKDIWIPIRCVKCQGYSHTHDSCIGIEKCTNCTSEFHKTDTCDRQSSCVSCGPGSQHPSTSPTCPVFLQKCNAHTFQSNIPD